VSSVCPMFRFSRGGTRVLTYPSRTAGDHFKQVPVLRSTDRSTILFNLHERFKAAAREHLLRLAGCVAGDLRIQGPRVALAEEVTGEQPTRMQR